MATTQVTSLTVLFADISGSVSMYAALGDATASRVVSEALWLMAEAAGTHGGHVVETRGDEVLCTFESPNAALAAAVAMQRSMAEQLPVRNPDTPPGFGLHVGMHHGEVIVEDQQLYGDTVNRAARVRSLAKRGQVLLSADARALVDDSFASHLRFLDEVVLRGKSSPEAVYDYIWQTDATMIGLRPTQVRLDRRQHRTTTQLRLHYGDSDAEVGARRPAVMLGRGESADITVVDDMASREHARVEQRRGRFVLSDISTNGTYVDQSGKVSFVHRDEIVLEGRGRISLGREFDADAHIIHYAREELTDDNNDSSDG